MSMFRVAIVAWALALAANVGDAQSPLRVSLPYDPKVGDAFAALAQASTCSDGDSRQQLLDWSCGPCKRAGIDIVPGSIRIVERGEVGESNSTFLYIARVKNTHEENEVDGCIISVRGSKTIANWIKDFEFSHEQTPFDWCKHCEVEKGFMSIWTAVQSEVVQHLTDVGCAPQNTSSTDASSNGTNNLWITGHSMGAAVATAAMFTLQNSGYNVQRSINFESPRVGNKYFADAFNAEFGRSIPMFRVTHAKDPVVHLPMKDMGYHHVNSEIFYDKAGNHHFCEDGEDAACSDRYVAMGTLKYAADHCASPQVPNKNICNCDLINDEQKTIVV